MGMFNFFRTRRERESALSGLDASVEPAQQVNPLAMQVDSSVTEMHGLGDLGKVVSQLHELGEMSVQLQGQSQVLDPDSGIRNPLR